LFPLIVQPVGQKLPLLPWLVFCHYERQHRTFVSFNCSGGVKKTSFSSNDLSSPDF
jgi:hypothetical protein